MKAQWQVKMFAFPGRNQHGFARGAFSLLAFRSNMLRERLNASKRRRVGETSRHCLMGA